MKTVTRRSVLGTLLISAIGYGWSGNPASAAAATAKSSAPRTKPPMTEMAPPRIKALLEEAWSVEKLARHPQDEKLAIALYCEAARFGNPEAHYRAGLLYLNGSGGVRNRVMAKSFLYNAMSLGHHTAPLLLPDLRDTRIEVPECLTQQEAYRTLERFDFTHHLNQLPQEKRKIAALVAKLAPAYGVDPDLAVAVASVESHFDARAQSPRNAQGVMQLIPETAERFGVRNPWNPEDNIRGGLSYLRWLMRRFDGNREKVVAAYNAGEGAVDRYRGIPPYYETRSYVFRVLSFARTTLRRPAPVLPALPAVPGLGMPPEPDAAQDAATRTDPTAARQPQRSDV